MKPLRKIVIALTSVFFLSACDGDESTASHSNTYSIDKTLGLTQCASSECLSGAERYYTDYSYPVSHSWLVDGVAKYAHLVEKRVVGTGENLYSISIGATAFTVDEYVYSFDSEGFLSIYDVASDEQYEVVGRSDDKYDYGYIHYMTVSEGYLVVFEQSNILIFDIRDLANISLESTVDYRFYERSSFYGSDPSFTLKEGIVAFQTESHAVVFDVSNPLLPVEMASIPRTGEVKAMGELLFVENNEQINVYGIATDHTLKLNYSINEYGRTFEVANNTLVLLDKGGESYYDYSASYPSGCNNYVAHLYEVDEAGYRYITEFDYQYSSDMGETINHEPSCDEGRVLTDGEKFWLYDYGFYDEYGLVIEPPFILTDEEWRLVD